MVADDIGLALSGRAKPGARDFDQSLRAAKPDHISDRGRDLDDDDQNHRSRK
jgi:hypothetical protein